MCRTAGPVSSPVKGVQMDMDRFVRRQNVERYCRLHDNVAEEPERQRILELLAQERQKQKDAGDPEE
jgi:hypothetical protein